MNIRRGRRRLLQTLLTSLVILFQLLSPLTVLAEDLVRQAQTATPAAVQDTPPPASEQPHLSPEEAQAAVMRALQDLLNVPPDAPPQVAQLYGQALDDAMARYAATVQSAPADSARPAAPPRPPAVAPPVPADTATPGAPQPGDEAFLWYMEAQPDAAAGASPQAPAGEQGASWLLLAQPEGDKARFDEAFSRMLAASLNEPASASSASNEPAPAEAALLTPDTPPQAKASQASGSTPWHRSLLLLDEDDWAVQAVDAQATLLTPDTPPQPEASQASGSTPWHRNLVLVADEDDWALKALNAEAALLTPDTPPQAKASQASGSTLWHRSLLLVDEDNWALKAVDAEAALLTPDTPPQAEASQASGSTPRHRSLLLVDEHDRVNDGPSYATRADHSKTFILATDWDTGIGNPGLDGEVKALAMGSGGLYAGGDFISGEVQKWNGSSWSPLGSGPGGTVYALTFDGETLYAGGDFGIKGVKRWNGSSWVNVGSDSPDATVYGLAVAGEELYAGGTFYPYLARYDGSAWYGVSGLNGEVRALASNGPELYVGGDFADAGNVARWNGVNKWTSLGKGSNGPVKALALTRTAKFGSPVYVGGDFDKVDGTAVSSNNVGSWDAPTTSLSLTKSATPSQAPTEAEVRYTLRIANSAIAGLDATNLALRDILPQGFTFVSADPDKCTADGRIVNLYGPWHPACRQLHHAGNRRYRRGYGRHLHQRGPCRLGAARKNRGEQRRQSGRHRHRVTGQPGPEQNRAHRHQSGSPTDLQSRRQQRRPRRRRQRRPHR